MVVVCNVDALIIPATAPVPTKRTATGIIFVNPNVIYSLVCFHFPQAITPMIPPTGKAINGSTVIPANGRKANKRMATTGPITAAKKLGKSS